MAQLVELVVVALAEVQEGLARVKQIGVDSRVRVLCLIPLLLKQVATEAIT